MPRDQNDDKKTALLTKAASASKAPGPYVQAYFKNVPPGDVIGLGQAALGAIALSHFTLGAKRPRGRVRVRAHTPTLKKNGWKTPRTVIEIVTDDMPFLVDSVMTEINRQGMAVHLVVHPVFGVRRDGGGQFIEFCDRDDPRATAESFMHIQVSQVADPTILKELEQGIEAVLSDVRAAVEDWPAMREKMSGAIADLINAPKRIPLDDVEEACSFLQWIHDDQFTYLGYREYAYQGEGSKVRAAVVSDTGLGVLRDPDITVLEELRNIEAMPASVKNTVQDGDVLMVTKSSRVSTVHRPVHMDAIGIKVYGAGGEVVGERVFVGLFTSNAYNLNPRSIPLLRLKIERVSERTGFAPSSHNAKAFLNILETYPRDELFQTSESDLYRIGMGILHLQERQHTALFMRTDDFERFVSCLIFLPRDDYTTDLRRRVQTIIEDALGGKVTAHYAQLGDAPLARLHIIVQTEPGNIPPYSHDALEQHITAEARTWSDKLSDVLAAEYGEHKGLSIHKRYARAFPAGYRDQFDASAALSDIEMIEEALHQKTLALNPYRVPGAGDSRLRFKIYHPNIALPLSDVLPMLEHLGLRVLDEIPHQVSVASFEAGCGPQGTDNKGKKNGPCRVMIHDFGVETRSGAAINLSEVADKFREAFLQVWQGRAESDGFNGLILNAGMTVREISLLRAYAKYLRQAGIAFSQRYMEETLINNAGLARLLVALFDTRFNPGSKAKDAKARARAAKKIESSILSGLDAVSNADEDRIIRRFLNLIQSTLRTNYYQPTSDGKIKDYISFKLDSHAVEELPLPRPLREIFVSSPRAEGVHLRFGLVARGGLRWSDRMEDFRTEVLGLVKAQQVKNAVIVPVGSKGGFVVKRPPADGGRDAFQAEGIECYKIFIRGLLDVTDNYDAKGRVVPPKNVVRMDGDDPYLVVAADKGTATFSDIANGVSADYGFWLGDAFASGGSQGYDHKKMGITARGGWESVKRHFREIGTDIQKEDFTVVGIGDMAGDVFGNGMLLSKHIRLIGAFNHMHIFIDPDPDAAKSFVERKRLFNKARSSWADYDEKLLSKGGRIYERSAKSLKLTPEIKARFGFSSDTVTPGEMISTLLKVEVDLLWFGGIGTYVKASHQSHVDAGDRTNDQIRVDGNELRCRVIGEGANLGITQEGRIEFALGGGQMNTDSIDNSAGVDCSDHEVNIKILLDQLVRDKKLGEAARNKQLADMTDEVGLLVLRDNYLQTQAITNIQALGVLVTDHQMRLMRVFERLGRLDRRVENLPDDETLTERVLGGQGLTRPETAVLISYSKIWLYDEIMTSNLPDDPVMTDDLITYFPEPLQKKYAKAIDSHRLKREIIATRITNSIVNRVGGTFVTQHMEKTGMRPADIARAYTIAAKVFELRTLWLDIEALDNRVSAQVQTSMFLDINKLIDRVVAWLLRNAKHPMSIEKMVAEFGIGVAAIRADVKKVLPKRYVDDIAVRAQPYLDAGVPKALAHEVTGLLNFAPAFDIVQLAEKSSLGVAEVAALYFAIGTRFRLGHLRAACERLDADTHWQKLAIAALVEEIFSHQRTLTEGALKGAKKGGTSAAALDTWAAQHKGAVERADQMLAELWSGEIGDIAMVTVAARGLGALAASA